MLINLRRRRGRLLMQAQSLDDEKCLKPVPKELILPACLATYGFLGYQPRWDKRESSIWLRVLHSTEAAAELSRTQHQNVSPMPQQEY